MFVPLDDDAHDVVGPMMPNAREHTPDLAAGHRIFDVAMMASHLAHPTRVPIPHSCFYAIPRVKWPAVVREGVTTMKVWIDQDLCTGDGLCEEIAPDVFTLLDDGLAYVREGDKIYATAKGNPQGAEGLAEIPDGQLDAVIESAEECPGECIYIEP
jgi:ferredoxin